MRKSMKFGKDDEAVSPVIGVILMVAITVILAAVIATFVFEMGTPTKTPMVNMQIKRAQVNASGNGSIILTHSGGETIKLSDVKLIVYSDSSHKTIVNPLLEFGNVTALAPGSDLKLIFNASSPKGLVGISIDDVRYNNLGTGYNTGTYLLDTPGQAVTIEFWYIPSGQRLGKIDGATIP